MTMITPSYLGETIEYSSLHACRSTLEDPIQKPQSNDAIRRAGHFCLLPSAFSLRIDSFPHSGKNSPPAAVLWHASENT